MNIAGVVEYLCYVVVVYRKILYMVIPSKRQDVSYIRVSGAYAGQRIDNFLFREYKNMPKSHIYRVIRSGELRVNSGRVKPSYKLTVGDQIRLPPLRYTPSLPPRISATDVAAISKSILYEDDELLVINKPAYLAVHSGTAHSFGLIDLLRYKYSANEVGLAHRLDKDTSGCLVVAKSRGSLLRLQKLFRDSQVEKVYQTLVVGCWRNPGRVAMPLRRVLQQQVVADNGRHAVTDFSVIHLFKNYSLMSVSLITGRTHQIRVHAAQCGHPIVGDKKYGDFSNNRKFAQLGLRRIFLHAYQLSFEWDGNKLLFEAPLPDLLQSLLKQLVVA